jgi:hypothetical protein
MEILNVCILLAITGCASTQSDKSYTVSFTPSVEKYAHPVRFEGYDYLVAEEDKVAERELREPDYSLIPAVGYIIFRTGGGTLETAKPSRWLFIITDDTGKEFYRSYGTDIGTPNYTVTQYGTNWYDIEIIRIEDETIQFPIKLHVVGPGDWQVFDIVIAKKDV